MVLKLSIYIISSFIALAILACGSQASDITTEVSNDTETMDGATIYKKKCKVCHGKDGKRGLAGASDLSISELTNDQAINVVTLGRRTMVGFQGDLTEEEITAVVDHIQSLKKAK